MSSRPAEERLRALQKVTDAALSDLPLEQMLGELLSRLTELLAADTAAILLLEEDGRTLVARAAKGLEEEVERQLRIPVGSGFAGRIARERRTVRVPDIAHANVLNPLLREKGLTSLLGVPLLLEGRLLGVMHVGSLAKREFEMICERASTSAAGIWFCSRSSAIKASISSKSLSLRRSAAQPAAITSSSRRNS